MKKVKLSLKKKLLKTSTFIIIINLLNLIKLPVSAVINNVTNPFVLFYDSITGGAFTNLSITCLGIIPFTNASIIVSLLTLIIPKMQHFKYEGNYGIKKLNRITNIIGVLITIIMSTVLVNYLTIINLLYDLTLFNKLILITLICSGTLLMMVLCNKITKINLVNGTSIVIAFNILQYIIMNIVKDINLVISNLSGMSILLVTLKIGIVVMAILTANTLLNIENKIPAYIVTKVSKNQTEFSINFIGSITTATIFTNMLLTVPNMLHLPLVTPYVNLLIILFGSIVSYKISLSTLYDTNQISRDLAISSISLDGINQGKATKEFLDRFLVINSIKAGIVTALVILVTNYCSRIISLDLQGLFILVSVIKGFIFSYNSNRVVEKYKGFLCDIK